MYGKALGNGYAITAVVGKKNVMEAAQKTFISSTFWTERTGPTAALKTLRKRKGKDRAHIAVHSHKCKFYKYISLNQQTRENQEITLSNSIIYYINECINRL